MRRLSALLLLSVLVSALPAWSQVTPVLYVSGGSAFPQGPDQFQSFYTTGVHLSAGAGVQVTPDVEFIVAVRHSRFRLDESGVVEGLQQVGFTVEPGNISGSTSTATGADLNAKFSTPLTPRTRFYFSGGGGMYRRSVFDVTLGPNEQPIGDLQGAPSEASETSLSLNFGMGLQYALNRDALLFFEPRYRLLFADSSDLFYLPVQAGLMYRL
jgi:hypothetical protein